MLRPAVQVEEPVAVGAQVSAAVANDDGRSFSVVVIFTRRPGIRAIGSGAARPRPFARRQAFDMVFVEDAE